MWNLIFNFFFFTVVIIDNLVRKLNEDGIGCEDSYDRL